MHYYYFSNDQFNFSECIQDIDVVFKKRLATENSLSEIQRHELVSFFNLEQMQNLPLDIT
jgi:hypothetical protein